MAYLVQSSISEGCRGQGEVLRNRSLLPVPEWNPLPPVRLTATGPALVRSCSWRSPAQVPWRWSLQQRHQLAVFPSISSPWGSDACHAPLVA